MKLASCGKEILISLLQQFNQIHFSLPKWEIVQESLAQINRYHSLLTIEESGKESKLLGRIVWRNV
jgi:hypothetical protein